MQKHQDNEVKSKMPSTEGVAGEQATSKAQAQEKKKHVNESKRGFVPDPIAVATAPTAPVKTSNDIMPSIGRIVHTKHEIHGVCAAIITGVNDVHNVNYNVQIPGGSVQGIRNAVFDGTPANLFQWCWPARV